MHDLGQIINEPPPTRFPLPSEVEPDINADPIQAIAPEPNSLEATVAGMKRRLLEKNYIATLEHNAKLLEDRDYLQTKLDATQDRLDMARKALFWIGNNGQCPTSNMMAELVFTSLDVVEEAYKMVRQAGRATNNEPKKDANENQ